MKKLLPFFAAVLSLTIEGFADDRLRDVQSELKTEGFYYGEINGENTSETTAAIRRFQIRNGLEVTGTLSDETIKALGIGVAPAARVPQEVPPPAAPAPPPAARANPPVDLRRDRAIEESDRSFLHREEAQRRSAEPAQPIPDEDPSAVPAPRSLEAPSAELPVFFANTPYANAPRAVQESTLRRAQSFLASHNMYRDAIDGEPGPATEEAILTYQRKARLPLTGRLDLQTLNLMRLLPGAPPVKGLIPEQPQTTRIYRGIWIR